MRHVSETVYGMLMSQGLARGAGATAGSRGIGDGERSRESALNHQPTNGEGGEPRQSMGMEKGATAKPRQVYREVDVKQMDEATANLRLVSSRCIDMATPTRKPRAAMSIHLVLVVSR